MFIYTIYLYKLPRFFSLFNSSSYFTFSCVISSVIVFVSVIGFFFTRTSSLIYGFFIITGSSLFIGIEISVLNSTGPSTDNDDEFKLLVLLLFLPLSLVLMPSSVI